jgi:hypothetical protein
MTAGGSIRACAREGDEERRERWRLRDLRKSLLRKWSDEFSMSVRPIDDHPPLVSWIYFAVNKEYRLLKVGISTNVDQRLKSLSQPVPLELLFKFPGSKKDEAFCLRALLPYRATGEWFRLNRESEIFAEGLRAHYLKRAQP